MPRRFIFSDRQRSALFGLPTDQTTLLKYYTLADDDIEHIKSRRRAHNQFGFALQLCAFRYPGRLLSPGELIPAEITEYLAAQLGMNAVDLADYAHRPGTRREHLSDLRAIYGYQMFSGQQADELKAWLSIEAETVTSNIELAQKLVGQCRKTQTILPGVSVVERLCANALVAAERRIDSRIVEHLNTETKVRLDALLEDLVEDRVTRFIWLRRFEVGNNSADMGRLLDRLEFLKNLKLPTTLLASVPPQRVSRLRRQGERYFADGLRDISSDRRLAVLAVCVIEWEAAIADAVVETHDRIVGKIWRDANKMAATQIDDAKHSLKETLRSFTDLGTALLSAHEAAEPLEPAITSQIEWSGLEKLVSQSAKLTNTLSLDPLNFVGHGYHKLRRYAPRMLQALDIQAATVAEPLLEAAKSIPTNGSQTKRSNSFLRRNSKWRRILKTSSSDYARLWEVAVLFHLRDAFRSGDIWLAHSKRYADLKHSLVPFAAVEQTPRLTVPFDPDVWLSDRKARLKEGLKRLARAARQGAIPGGSIQDGVLKVERFSTTVPEEANALVLDLYRRLPDVRITEILLDVADSTGLVDAFTHLRTGAPCTDKIGVLTVLLAEGLNLGLSKMADAINTHDYFQLSRLSRWHMDSDAINQALAMVIEAQGRLPMARLWGASLTASSDGQFFPTTRQGEAMNLISAKYGPDPGVKAYTHVSDQFGPFAMQNIPATVSEAPYILDGLLMNETGQKIREQYADTGGFTDHVFAVTALLSYRFIPRIRDLPSKRLYVFDRQSTPKELKGLIGGKIRENVIVQNWPDILRAVATMVAGNIAPSQLLRKFAAYPRQHELAVALREMGRIERTLFIIEWLLDTDMQRRAQVGLNKGEAHHALKNALRIGRQGEIRDRTAEGQHYRLAGLNLLAAIIIYWNTEQLGYAVRERQSDGLDCDPALLSHISPLGWAHILLTGEYRWPKR